MRIEIIVTIIGLCASISSIIFAMLSFKRSEKQDHHKKGKDEGLILSDIGYIKSCVDRVEKSLNKVNEKYHDVLERLAKVEESIVNIGKRVDALYTNGGG
ncbi:putative uncharacterized protein [Coprobacillus sp. CAG:698]|nr:putative uncharacterized protein [Coprobacillus sp. CAG:698]